MSSKRTIEPICAFSGFGDEPNFTDIEPPRYTTRDSPMWNSPDDEVVLGIWTKLYQSFRKHPEMRVRYVCVYSGQQLWDITEPYFHLLYTGQIPIWIQLIQVSGISRGHWIPRAVAEIKAFVTKESPTGEKCFLGLPYEDFETGFGGFEGDLASSDPNRSIITVIPDYDRALLNKLTEIPATFDILVFDCKLYAHYEVVEVRK